MEKLINCDIKTIMANARQLLVEEGFVPANCPKKNCLWLSEITLGSNEINLLIEANPPQLPTSNPQLHMYETDPICDKLCKIEANPNRCFKIKQKSNTSKILSVEAELKSDFI